MYIHIYTYNWRQYYPKLIFLNIYVYTERNEVGDPIVNYGRKAVVDNNRKILYIYLPYISTVATRQSSSVAISKVTKNSELH